MSITTATVTTVGNTVYTSSGNTAITWLSLNNWGPGNATANLFVVPSGNLASTSNQVYYSLLLSSGDTYQIYAAAEKLVLGNGDTIQVTATANTITAVTSYTAI
jgi:hypothetical protein